MEKLTMNEPKSYNINGLEYINDLDFHIEVRAFIEKWLDKRYNYPENIRNGLEAVMYAYLRSHNLFEPF